MLARLNRKTTKCVTASVVETGESVPPPLKGVCLLHKNGNSSKVIKTCELNCILKEKKHAELKKSHILGFFPTQSIERDDRDNTKAAFRKDIPTTL